MKSLLMSLFILCVSCLSLASVDGGILGRVLDQDEMALSGVRIEVKLLHQATGQTTSTGISGEFRVAPLDIGQYQVTATMPGYETSMTTVAISSGSNVELNVRMNKQGEAKEIVLNVKEKRNVIHTTSSGSQKTLDQDQIAALPQGQDVSLPKLISSTVPGVIAGPFGQTFIRGNHANLQYQIDGVQLPESTSGSFGDAFSPRNIDHMEVITGGVPAEYGERLAAVLNIVTKAGTEDTGGNISATYGSYNTSIGQANISGSNKEGNIHYFASVRANQTARGLDTPQPSSTGNQTQGGNDAVHDFSTGNEEFLRVDDILNNTNKITVTAFNSYVSYQIPNFPGSFKSTDPYFSSNYTDQFGNSTSGSPITTYVPQGTNDTQTESNSFIQAVWKHTFADNSFMQVAPFFKLSQLNVSNDLFGDLSSATGGANPITGASPDSFALSRSTSNMGTKVDYTLRSDDQNLWKAGMIYQYSQSVTGKMSIWTSLSQPPNTFSGRDDGQIAGLYLQDSYHFAPKWTLNAGLRLTGTSFQSDGVYSTDGMLQPRVGLEWMVVPETKLHIFYGKLFQPAPFENLREAFSTVGNGQLSPYDLKAEKDDYYEIGVTQHVGQSHSVDLVYYYKSATNMLDDTALLNTSIAQPYNFAQGYANGIELSLNGDINSNFSDYFNYAYEDARGQGISGGIFAFDPGSLPSNSYQFLDHVQLNTATLGLTYKTEFYWSSLQGLYGSGLRTGTGNGSSLPSHVTFDWTVGYKFSKATALAGFSTSLDWLNITNNMYPITIANGFNTNHYAAGSEVMWHIARDF